MFFYHVLHSVGCLVIGNTHIFSNTWKYAIVCLFKLLTLHHLQLILLTFTVCTFPRFSTIHVFLHLSFSFSLSDLFLFPSITLSIAYYSCSSSLSPSGSESWAVTGGPWQEVGWLVLQVTLYSCGSPRAKYSLLWYGISVGPIVVVAFLNAIMTAHLQLFTFKHPLFLSVLQLLFLPLFPQGRINAIFLGGVISSFNYDKTVTRDKKRGTEWEKRVCDMQQRAVGKTRTLVAASSQHL